MLVQEEERRAARTAERETAESKKMLRDETRRQNDMQLKIKKDYETEKEQNDLVLTEKVSVALSNSNSCLFTIWYVRVNGSRSTHYRVFKKSETISRPRARSRAKGGEK